MRAEYVVSGAGPVGSAIACGLADRGRTVTAVYGGDSTLVLRVQIPVPSRCSAKK